MKRKSIIISISGYSLKKKENELIKKGAKKEELDWMDIDGLIKSYKPNERIAIEDLITWLKDHQIELFEETLYGHDEIGTANAMLESGEYSEEDLDIEAEDAVQITFKPKPKKEAPVEKIIEKMGAYNQRKIDRSFITEVMKIQSLIEEINK